MSDQEQDIETNDIEQNDKLKQSVKLIVNTVTDKVNDIDPQELSFDKMLNVAFNVIKEVEQDPKFDKNFSLLNAMNLLLNPNNQINL